MSNVQLISNHGEKNHLKHILQDFEDSDEIWMATAFLKISGLTLLLPSITKHIKANRQLHIIAGQNFGLTEPIALRTLHTLFLKKLNANLYLDKANTNQKIFHPKLFAFRKEKNIHVISGSSNITKGGLMDNEELSIFFKTTTSNAEWQSLMTYFTEITSTTNADAVTLMIIKRYEQFYNEQKTIRKNQKAAPDRKSKDYNFDYTKLKQRLKNYDLKSFKDEFRKREKDYETAKQLLDETIDSKKLSQQRFEDIIDTLVGKKGQKALWRSGSLLRLRHEVYGCKKEFRELVKFIRDHQKESAEKVFINAKELVKPINGARMNYVAEIMMTYQPNRFANLNSNPITVLHKEAGVYFKSHSDSFNGANYEEYCEIIKEICSELNLKNMLEADSFINEVYWELKEESETN